MKTRFEKLFTLAVTHAYHGGICEDFSFVLPAEADRLVRRGRLLSRVRGGVLYVLFEADDAGQPRVPLWGETLRVGLRLDNPFFLNFTDPALPRSPRVWLYRNGAAPAALDPPEVRVLVGSVPEGSPGPLHPELLHPELLRAGVSGVVDIALDAGFPSSPPAFAISFEARRETLKYYLVVEGYTGSEFERLKVTDRGYAEEDRPEIGFSPVLEAPSDGLAPALLTSRGARLAVCTSTAPVARRQRGRRKIQLSRNGEVLIDHLPQPGPERADATMILHLSKQGPGP